MSYYSEKDGDTFYNIPTNDDIELYLILKWEELKKNNYIWEDINGKRYTAEQLAKYKRYLKNIIRFAKVNDRPQEQITVLESLQ